MNIYIYIHYGVFRVLPYFAMHSVFECVACRIQDRFRSQGGACWGLASTRQTCLVAPSFELLPKSETALHNFRIWGSIAANPS